MTWATSSCPQWEGHRPIARGCTQVGLVQPSPEDWGEGRSEMTGWTGLGDDVPKPQAAARLFVRELMGQIKTSWESDAQRYGSGLSWTCSQFYKLEKVVVVDPQITVMAAPTQKKKGVSSTLRPRRTPWCMRSNISRIIQDTSFCIYSQITKSVKETGIWLVCEIFFLDLTKQLWHLKWT